MYIQKEKVTLSSLGSNGRFGNQIFQYAFLRIYAKYHNLDFETPYWIGEYLFGHNDARISSDLPLVKEEEIFLSSEYNLAKESNAFRNVDLYGYFLYYTKFYNHYKEFFLSLFKPQSNIISQMQPSLDILKSQGKTIVGIHIRRGDFGKYPYYIAPSSWYKKYLDGLWQTLDNPVLFIASDEILKSVKDFSQYNPISCKDLDIKLAELDFYPDFYLLNQCDVLLISNSTFSFAASMLNERCKIFARPHFDFNKLIPFDPWNSQPFIYSNLARPKLYNVFRWM